jgi:hypothetical protein
VSLALRRFVLVYAVAVVAGLGANAHAGDPDQPLRPRMETPAESEARKKRPQFAKPSELEGGHPAAVASGSALPAVATGAPAAAAPAVETSAVGAQASAASSDRSFAIPRTYSYLSGYWRDWSGDTLLQRPYAPNDGNGESLGRTSLFMRGFYYALNNELRDWSGVELIGSIDVTKRVGVAAGLRHELRDTTADQAVVSVSTLLGRDVALLGTFAAGNGAEFIPITELAAETRVRVAERQRLQYAFGAGVSWWPQTRRMLHLDAAGIFQYSKTFSAEYRLQFHRIDSDTAAAHVFPRTTMTFLHGVDGNWLLQERITVGQAPLYGPGVDLGALSYKLSMDVAVSLRKWVRPTYGYIIGVDYGVQEDRYQRLGFDFAVFVQR